MIGPEIPPHEERSGSAVDGATCHTRTSQPPLSITTGATWSVGIAEHNGAQTTTALWGRPGAGSATGYSRSPCDAGAGAVPGVRD